VKEITKFGSPIIRVFSSDLISQATKDVNVLKFP